MSIDGISGAGTPKRPESPGSRPSERGKSSPAAAGGDRVELSPAARRITTLAEAAAALPEVRQEAVDRLREAVEGGTYEVDARLVARALLEFEDGAR